MFAARSLDFGASTSSTVVVMVMVTMVIVVVVARHTGQSKECHH